MRTPIEVFRSKHAQEWQKEVADLIIQNGFGMDEAKRDVDDKLIYKYYAEYEAIEEEYQLLLKKTQQ